MSETADPASQPGESLRLARERAGLSCVEVAERLNLTAFQIEMLEAENYQALAGPAYVQGYLRAYARLLGLDGTALVAAYRSRIQLAEPGAGKAPRRRPNLDRGGSQRHWGLAALLVVLAGLWSWQHWSGSGDSEPATPEPMATGSPEQEALSEPGGSEHADLSIVPALSRQAPLADGSGGPDPEIPPADAGAGIPAGTSAGSSADGAPGAGDSPAAEEPSGPGTAAAPSSPDAGPDRLTLRFSDDCWIEVYDHSGDRLATGLKRADQVLELTGDAPFRVLLGFAPAVEMDFNGRPVSIRADGSDQTATLVVGARTTGNG